LCPNFVIKKFKTYNFVFTGVDQDSIRTSYKRLALKWHPDKHSGSQEALKVTCYKIKYLTTRLHLGEGTCIHNDLRIHFLFVEQGSGDLLHIYEEKMIR